MVENSKLRTHLCWWLSDTCNRYFHVLDDLGVINRRKAKAAGHRIIERRNEMLDEYAPLFVEAMLAMLSEGDDPDWPWQHEADASE